MQIGKKAMPKDFKYKDVFLRGMPEHTGSDSFTARHPPMPASRWAKIFSPFDALKGFDEAIADKEKPPVRRREPGEDEQEELNWTLSRLKELVPDRRTAKENKILVSITHFEEEEPGCGEYIETAGTVLCVDEIYHRIELEDNVVINFKDIHELRILHENDPISGDGPEY